MSLLSDLDAFYLEHGKCGEVGGDVVEEEQRVLVWMSCSCGGRLCRQVVKEPE